MIVLVTGAAGQLGNDVAKMLRQRNHKVFSTDLAPFYTGISDQAQVHGIPYCAMDFTNPAACERVIGSVRADAVVHCGAWSDMASAELPDNHRQVFKTNIRGTENIALVCKRMGIKLILISSDRVYRPSQDMLSETAALEPLSVYGRSKMEAEKLVNELVPKSFIVRTQWLYGSHGDNFIKKFLTMGGEPERTSVKAASDFIGTPTYTKDLARLIVDMLESESYGTYNAIGGGGYASMAEVAAELFRRAGIKSKILPVRLAELSDEMHTSVGVKLSTDKLRECHFRQLPPWDAAIGRFLDEIKYPRRIRTKQ